MRKIAIDTRDLKKGKTGTFTYLKALCHEFASNPEVLFIPYPFPVYTGPSYIGKIAEHVLFFLWKQIYLPLYCSWNRVDALLCTDYFLPLIPLSTRKFVVFHDAFFFEQPAHYNALWLKLFHSVAVPAAKRAEAVIVPTEYVKTRLLHFMPEIKNIQVITEGAKPLSVSNGTSRFDKPYVLHVGTLDHRKNLPRLVEAFSQLDWEGLLVLAGDSPAYAGSNGRAELEKIIQQKGLQDRVLLIGRVTEEELANLYAHAHAYVFPSLNEGFGLPLVEAMQQGIPCAAADNTAMPEVGGEAVLYFDPYNSTAIRDTLQLLVTDETRRAHLKQAGLERVKLFQWPAVAEAFLFLLHRPLRVAMMGVKGYPYVYGGYETLIKELVERLEKKHMEVTVYCHRSLFSERPAQVNGINLIYVPSVEKKSLSQLTHTLFSTLHACLFKRPDVIFYVNAANGPFGLLTRLFRIPTVINVDGMEWLRPKWRGLGAKYFYFAAKQATRWMDHLVTDAVEMQKTYQELFQAESSMIAYGADPFIPASIELVNPWKLESGSYFLIVGRLIPDNNSDLLIDGYLQAETDKKLVIVGDDVFNDAYAQAIKEKIKGNPNILFTGYVKDSRILSALYQHSYAYLHGHEFGGTNPTLIKALAEGAGIAALGTRFNREVLAEGEFGLLFEKNPKAIAKCLLASEEVFADFRAKAQDRIIDTYNWDYIATQYERIFVNSQHEGNL